MGDNGPADILLFEGFRLDRRAGGLFRLQQQDVSVPVHLGWRALDLLAHLAERAGHLVLKNAIMQAVWPGKVVEEANLNVQISKLRRVLDRDRDHGSCIQTVTGYGYRFVGRVTRIEPATAPATMVSMPNRVGRSGEDSEAADPTEAAFPLARTTRDLLIRMAAETARTTDAPALDGVWGDTTPQGRLMLTVLRGLAAFERDLIEGRNTDSRLVPGLGDMWYAPRR
jgi:DNA-binding winged helix-turn-helix (wHTH) protein